MALSAVACEFIEKSQHRAERTTQAPHGARFGHVNVICHPIGDDSLTSMDVSLAANSSEHEHCRHISPYRLGYYTDEG
jgi:hypothetical protein